MKNFIAGIVALISFTVVFSACKGETYIEKLQNEEKAIGRFLDENKIKVLSEFPENAVFAENEYYLDKTTGVYIHVLDKGTDEKPSKQRRTEVFLRYDTVFNLQTGAIESHPNWKSEVPMSFKFGVTSTYYNSQSNGIPSYYLLSQACVVPLENNLGNKAAVKIIVPFQNGSTAQQSAYKTLLFSRLEYHFVLDSDKE